MKNFLLLLFLVVSIKLFSQPFSPSSNGTVIIHDYYSLDYNENHEQANWVYYKLYPDLIYGSVERTNNFRDDPYVDTGSASSSDYKGSGYDRGHLCPAADMKLNITSMSESFYLSNMSPQDPSFNRGGWKKLESIVRNWASNDTIYVVTGPVFNDNKGKIGANKVTIPGYYYKVIYCPSKQKMIGFLMPNKKIINEISSYIQTVDKIEYFTGIDFFHALDDQIENKLELNVDLHVWNLTGFSNYKSSNDTYSSKSTSKYSSDKTYAQSTSQQCKGIAKSTRSRCKNKTKNSNGYCYIHKDQFSGYVEVKKSQSSYHGRCCATTQKGSRCKRNASSGSRYCWQHQ